MLRNLENIWSKILVNSEEFAMFAVPNIYNLGMLCLYISKNSQYSGVSLTHNSLRLWVFGDIWRGSASSFVQKIINQIFSCQMPNTTEKFEVKVQSVPTSQGSKKTVSKLEKSGKDFEKSEKCFMFAVDSDQESTNITQVTAFFMLLSDVSYLKNKLLKSRWIAVLGYMQLILGRIREASSFLYLPKFSLTFNSFTR